MPDTDPHLPFDWRKSLSWPRVRFTVGAGLMFGLLFSIDSPTPAATWVGRALVVAGGATLAYVVLEQRPRQLPASVARWVLQLLAIVASIPIAAYIGYWATTGSALFWQDSARLNGYGKVVFSGVLFAPWLALGAMVRQREAFARHQALAFELERSEFRRKDLDSRLSLVRAQVQPHFLFNTLANVRALVKSNAPNATVVLDSLIAYLRASVPRLDDTASTLGQELDLVRAYLQLMHTRMPDRLRFDIQVEGVDPALRCPALTLLTLVENAIRHGIDPAENGGDVAVRIVVHDGRCIARVSDTGIGLSSTGHGLGTGLASLRERLASFYDGPTMLTLTAAFPHGVVAEIEFPVFRSAR